MLEPREADIPALFLFFVVLPVVTYILLGKWNDASKKNARISMLAQLAAEEACSVEAMAAVDVVQPVPAPNTGMHYCARCFSPASTRCSRCKSIRYCSGKCQIIHWRQGHRQECQLWETQKIISSTAANDASYGKDSADVKQKSTFFQNGMKDPTRNFSSLDTPCNSTVERRRIGEKDSQAKQEISRLEQGVGYCLEGAEHVGASPICDTAGPTMIATDGALRRHKFGDESCISSENTHYTQNNSCQMPANIFSDLRNMTHGTHSLLSQTRSAFESTSGTIAHLHSARDVADVCDNKLKIPLEKVHNQYHGFSSTSEDLDSSTGADAVKGEMKFKKPPYTVESNSSSQTPTTKLSRDHPVDGMDRKTFTEKEPYIHQLIGSTAIPRQDNNGNCNTGDKKTASMKKLSVPPKHGTNDFSADAVKKNKVLFPFEELVKFFQVEVFDISPRGLLNCGNSCYANAVLQCLTCTKPLMVYLLRGMHSRSCYVKEWCLMCELELHVGLLREGGGPLSPNKILSNMKNIGCRIGGGNQEDAHEFLRLLVMSMQSICLEGLGGEKKVDPRLQDTTLIQQIFGGCLRSKVKCLKCELESERYENIMDLTLEIHGWVESLEDALTQFTAPEDLDGDNMYRCGRCSTYVTARKQLSIHEAPNILTIVLKRFQTGRYGKINKCVTFPDMLDMIPYMTGISDNPPLYMLYAVVVHLDTFNASFSGHYVSYVKDLQGTWFRIDDTEVHPVHLSQVMSEGVYMLFYSRSFPRPPRIQSCKYTTTSVVNSIKPSMPRPPKSSRNETSKQSEKLYAHDVPSDAVSNAIPCFNDRDTNCISKNYTRRNMGRKGSFVGSGSADFSDATHSSDWSIFTSSDESSFTTESTSDSFSTVDYSDTANLDPISSLFSAVYIPEYSQKSSVSSCTKLSLCRPHTRFFSEHKGFVFDSWTSTMPPGTVHKGKNLDHLAAGSSSSRSYVKLDKAIPR